MKLLILLFITWFTDHRYNEIAYIVVYYMIHWPPTSWNYQYYLLLHYSLSTNIVKLPILLLITWYTDTNMMKLPILLFITWFTNHWHDEINYIVIYCMIHWPPTSKKLIILFIAWFTDHKHDAITYIMCFIKHHNRLFWQLLWDQFCYFWVKEIIVTVDNDMSLTNLKRKTYLQTNYGYSLHS